MAVGCQPHAPAACTPRDIAGTHFHEGLSRLQDHGLVGRKYVTEKFSDTTGNRSRDRLVAQRLDHYATPGPSEIYIEYINILRAECSTFEHKDYWYIY
jgi:hypothetical protein